MNIIFLDYDGVVNTKPWDLTGEVCRFNFPEDGAVNNYQSVQWVSEFCETYEYSIVVTSTWNNYDNYAECLIRGGLRKGIVIIGKTNSDLPREVAITEYLNEHVEIERYLIFDDIKDLGTHNSRLVKCNPYIGFTEREYKKAERLHKKL